MQDLFGSVRRSFARPSPNSDDPLSGLADKIGSCLRKSRAGLGLGLGFSPTKVHGKESPPPIRWRKGELLGSGAFGHVYMGMNLDSGELLAVKQVLIGTSGASKEKAQAHIRELEEELKVLKTLSHPNIVRYIGTVREEGTLNIFLEFVPGGSISSLLSKFGAFPEAVIRTYTKQLLQGLEYLHRNGIIHRDIKGANILVDNKGCIKLADFGASKQVAKLATMNAAKSMKGTPYWMAPEVILQTGHSFSADIWSVGCTVIEMATGKPPWSQQFQEVAALFHIGSTKSHPPIPEHLSAEAKDFLLKCLQKEPNLRSTASDLLQHPFVLEEFKDLQPIRHSAVMEQSGVIMPQPESYMKNSYNPMSEPTSFGCLQENSPTMFSQRTSTLRPIWETNTSNDMCQSDSNDDFPVVGASFNPMAEPVDGWSCKFRTSPEDGKFSIDNSRSSLDTSNNGKGQTEFTFPCEPAFEDDDEVTETKIRAFLDEKALDLKKLQEEFFNSLNNTNDSCPTNPSEDFSHTPKLPPKSKSPTQVASGSHASLAETETNVSPGKWSSRRASNSRSENNRILKEIPSPRLNEQGGIVQDEMKEAGAPSESFSEMRRKWKEELDRELEREREMMRQAGFGKASSPNERRLSRNPSRKRDHLRFLSPSK